jgi:hypothetical protein
MNHNRMDYYQMYNLESNSDWEDDNSNQTFELPSDPLITQTSTNLAALGKRRRPMIETMNEHQLQKKRAITHNCEYKYHAYWTLNGGRNPNFVPKYLVDRIPLPTDITADIFKTYLTECDKSILTGEFELISNTNQLPLWNLQNFVAVTQPIPGHFQFIRETIFEANPNNP